jgi:hypothetical protein
LSLGLRNDQLPPHIIAMQRLGVMNGYPPAWLARACLRRPAGADDRLTMITHADDDDLRRQEDGEIEDGTIMCACVSAYKQNFNQRSTIHN